MTTDPDAPLFEQKGFVIAPSGLERTEVPVAISTREYNAIIGDVRSDKRLERYVRAKIERRNEVVNDDNLNNLFEAVVARHTNLFTAHALAFEVFFKIARDTEAGVFPWEAAD